MGAAPPVAPTSSPQTDADTLGEERSRARARLYAPGATEDDVLAYCRLLTAQTPTSSESPDADGAAAAAVPLAHWCRRRQAARIVLHWATVPVLAVALGLVLLLPHAPHPTRERSSFPAFRIADVPIRQQLIQWPSSLPPGWLGADVVAAQDGARGGVVLQVPSTAYGDDLLLVVGCPTSAGAWTARSVWDGRSGAAAAPSRAGRCGPLATRVLTPFTTSVSVHVSGGSPFAAAVMAR